MKNKLGGQLHYDFLQLGWVMAIWTAWLLLDAVFGWQRWHGSGGKDWHHIVVYLSRAAVPLCGVAFVVVFAPALAFGFSPWRSDAFWRTRPLPIRHLLLSRLGFLLAFAFLAPLSIRFAVLTISGAEIGLALTNAFGYALGYLAGAGLLWGIAMHFRGWKQLLAALAVLALFGAFFFWSLAYILQFFLELFSRDRDAGLQHSSRIASIDGLIESRFLIAAFILVAGGVLTGAVLLRWKRRRWGIGALAGVLLAAAVISPNWPVNFFPAKTLGTVASPIAARTEGPPIDGLTRKADLLWNHEDVPTGHWIGLKDISTVYPANFGSFTMRRLETVDHPRGMELSIRTTFADRDIQPVPDSDELRGLSEGRDRFPAMSPWSGSRTVSGEVDVHWFRHEIAGSIPARPGARFFRDGYLLVVTDFRLDRSGSPDQSPTLRIELVTDRVEARFTGNEYWRRAPSSSPFEQWYLAMGFPEGGSESETRISRYQLLGRVPDAWFSEGGAKFHFPLPARSDPEAPPSVSGETLPECRLFILRPVYLETMSAPFEGHVGR